MKSTDATPIHTALVSEKMKSVTGGQKFPSLFRGETATPVSLTEPCSVVITVYDVAGSKVMTFTERMMSTGEHLVWITPEGFPSGSYGYAVNAGGHRIICTMTFIE